MSNGYLLIQVLKNMTFGIGPQRKTFNIEPVRHVIDLINRSKDLQKLGMNLEKKMDKKIETFLINGALTWGGVHPLKILHPFHIFNQVLFLDCENI